MLKKTSVAKKIIPKFIFADTLKNYINLFITLRWPKNKRVSMEIKPTKSFHLNKKCLMNLTLIRVAEAEGEREGPEEAAQQG